MVGDLAEVAGLWIGKRKKGFAPSFCSKMQQQRGDIGTRPAWISVQLTAG